MSKSGEDLSERVDGIIIKNEAMAWVKKYLIADSEVFEFNFLTISGMKAIKLISRPTQAISQDDEDTTTMVLKNMIKIRFKFIIFIKIKIGNYP